MGKHTNVSGQKFHRLTVLEELPANGASGGNKVVCQCECGKTITTYKYSLLCGKTKSCGCYRAHRHEHLVGQRFGKLTVLELFETTSGTGHIQYRAKCQCDCGNASTPMVDSLLSGKAESCGCRRDYYEKNSGSLNAKFCGYRDISGTIWCRIRSRAKSRNQEMDIDLPYIWELFEKQGKCCALTGLPISFARRQGSASLDRIDSNKGYLKGNVQWVHKIVNIMKNVYDVDDFVSICLLVAQQRGWKPPRTGECATAPRATECFRKALNP